MKYFVYKNLVNVFYMSVYAHIICMRNMSVSIQDLSDR